MGKFIVERALIVKPEPLERILRGHKVWEIRSKPTKIRGSIALLEKGSKQIVGVCTIVDSLEILLPEDYIKNARKMGLSKKQMDIRSKDIRGWFWLQDWHAWVIFDVRRFNKPIPFANPSGAVTWAKLPPDVARKVARTYERETEE